MVFNRLPLWLMLSVICLLVSFLTEIQSNSATTAMLMPIVAAMVCINIHALTKYSTTSHERSRLQRMASNIAKKASHTKIL